MLLGPQHFTKIFVLDFTDPWNYKKGKDCALVVVLCCDTWNSFARSTRTKRSATFGAIEMSVTARIALYRYDKSVGGDETGSVQMRLALKKIT